MRILIVGGTGNLGYKIATEAKKSAHTISALVRESSDASKLEELGATILRGDITKPETLISIFTGIDAVVTSAIGYAGRKSGDTLESVDDLGNRNLADAALKAKVQRFVFMSILTADNPKSVRPFHQKFLTEEYFKQISLPFIALRPGAFLDQELDRRKNGFAEGKLGTLVQPDVAMTYILADDVAHCAVAALTASGIENGDRIDLGLDRPTTSRQLAAELSQKLGYEIEPQFSALPTDNPDFDHYVAYMNSGEYVANVDKQNQFFSPVPTLGDSVQRWLEQVNLKGEPNGNN